MSIKEIREAALKADNKTQKALDHKSKFTDEQLLLLSERVEFAIKNICRLVKSKPSETHSWQYYIGNATWANEKLESYILLCNGKLLDMGYSEELVAVLSSFSEHGNPNAYCAPEDLTRHYVVFKEV